MKSFEVSFLIGAVLGSSFASTISTVEEKVKAVDTEVGSLGRSLKQMNQLSSLDESLVKNKAGLIDAEKSLAGISKELDVAKSRYSSLQLAVSTANDEVIESKNNYDQLRNRLSLMRAELQATEKPTQEMRQAISAKNLELVQSKQRFSESKDNLARLKTELQAATPAVKELEAAHKKATADVEMFEHTIRKETASIGSLGEELKKTRIDTDDLATAQKKLSDEYEKAAAKKARIGSLLEERDSLSAQRGRLNSLAIGAIGAGASLTIPVKLAMDKENYMVDVAKNVKGLDTAEDIQEMEMAIRSLGSSSLLGSDGIAKLVASAGAIGMGKDDALEFALSAEKIGVAFGLSADESGDLMTSIMASSGLSLSGINELSDAINFIGDSATAKAPEITKILQRNIGMLSGMTKLTKNEMVGLSSVFRGAAPSTEVAATAQKGFIEALTRGAAATKAQEDGFGKLGMSATELAERMQTDAEGAITDVITALSELDDAERGSVMTSVFGSSVTPVLAGLVSNIDEYRRVMSLAADDTKFAGSVQEEYERQMNTTSAALTTARGAIKEIGVTIGSALLPHVTMAAKVIGVLARGFSSFANANPFITKTIVGVGLAVTAFGTAAIAVGYGLNILRTGLVYTKLAFIGTSTHASWARVAIGRLGTVFSLTNIRMRAAAIGTRIWAGAQWLLNTAMSANPIGAIITGAVALASLGTFLYKKWEPFRNLINGIGEMIKSYWGFIGKLVGFEIGNKELAGEGEETKALAGKREETKALEGAGLGFYSTADFAPEAGMSSMGALSLGDFDPEMPKSSRGSLPLDVLPASGGRQNITLHITSSPTIVLQNGTAETAERALSNHEDNLATKIQEIFEKKQRLAYG